MNRMGIAAGVLATTASAAYAGGIDRSGQSVGVIFEQGNYAEFSIGHVSPNVSGVGAGAAPSLVTPTPGQSSGDMAPSYTQFSGALKFNLRDNLDVALIFDQPYGADVAYPAASTYFARGSVAELRSQALTGVVKYTFPSNVSIYGGLRYETLKATATIPFVSHPVLGAYNVKGEQDGSLGYLVGVAYEKPEIALRVALTYNSKIKHTIKTTEWGIASPDTIVNSPESVNLEFQSGIAKDTLIFGSIRWVDWSNFDISPAVYSSAAVAGSPLVSYDNDTVTYSIGIGRRFNENWSGAVSVGYEKASGGFSSNLGPTDGNLSLSLGATYTKDNMKITGGIRYVDVGDAQTTLGGGIAASDFTGNKAIGVGLKVGFSF